MLNSMQESSNERASFAEKLRSAVLYRDALMVAFLITCPVRARTLTSMQVSSFTEEQGTLWVNFAPAQVKTGIAIRTPIYEPLRQHISDYIAVHRPALLAGREMEAFWVSQRGNAMTEQNFGKHLQHFTEDLLGYAINPHQFRHIAATTIADDTPELYPIIADILGHKSLEMSQRHYDRATGKKSFDAYGSIPDPKKPSANSSD